MTANSDTFKFDSNQAIYKVHVKLADFYFETNIQFRMSSSFFKINLAFSHENCLNGCFVLGLKTLIQVSACPL